MSSSSSRRVRQNAGNADVARGVRRLLGSTGFDFTQTFQREVDAARLAVGKLSIDSNTPGETTGLTSRQTAIYLEADDLRLPRFSLSPEDRGSRLLERLFGTLDFDFEDSPEFSDRYFLTGTFEEHVRRLFGRELRDWFADRPGWPGWTMSGDGSRLILYRPRFVCPANELEPFVRDAVSVFRRVRDSADAMREWLAEQPQPGVDQMRAELDKLTGPLGWLVRRQAETFLIAPQEIRDFVNQPVPRTLPRQLIRQHSPDPLLVIFGTGFSTFSVAPVFIGQSRGELAMGLLAGTVCLLVGLLALVPAMYFPLRRRKLLRNGLLAEGRIDRVESTMWGNGSQRKHIAYVRYRTDSGWQSATCSLYGGAVNQAEAFVDEERTTTVLVDPASQRHILLPDLMGAAG